MTYGYLNNPNRVFTRKTLNVPSNSQFRTNPQAVIDWLAGNKEVQQLNKRFPSMMSELRTDPAGAWAKYFDANPKILKSILEDTRPFMSTIRSSEFIPKNLAVVPQGDMLAKSINKFPFSGPQITAENQAAINQTKNIADELARSADNLGGIVIEVPD
jgi:hypothetical protein